LQLIALNEIAEVAFFTELISNLTNHVKGYEIPSEQHNLIVNALLAAQHVSSLSNKKNHIYKFIARRAPCAQCERGSSTF
jgi:hypothetical protein